MAPAPRRASLLRCTELSMPPSAAAALRSRFSATEASCGPPTPSDLHPRLRPLMNFRLLGSPRHADIRRSPRARVASASLGRWCSLRRLQTGGRISAQRVAQDAVRTAYGNALADALDIAAAVVPHLPAIRAALRPDAVHGCRAEVTLVPSDVPRVHGVPRCGARDGESHYSTCPHAAALRALDPQWAAEELQAAWRSALRHDRLPRLVDHGLLADPGEPIDANAEQVALASADPDELRMLLNHAASALGDVLRIRLPDGRVFEGRPATRLRLDISPGNPA